MLTTNESVENYLETILVLSQKLPVVRSVDVANETGYKKSSGKSFFYKLPSHLECDRLIRSYATASPDCSKYIRPEKCSLPAYSI